MAVTAEVMVGEKRQRRLVRKLLYGLLILIVIYGLGRAIDVAMGSFYTGDRAPYLQMPAPTAMTLRWQTTAPTTGKVFYGTRLDTLDQHVDDGAEPAEEHEVRITGLQPDTRYYYRIEANGIPRYQGEDYRFRTPPAAGAATPVRFWVLGDPGYANPGQSAVRDAAVGWMKGHPRKNRPMLDFIMTTGDNAYRSGTNQQFQDNFFVPYEKLLRNYSVWPIYGNHDARRFAFFDIFSFPEQAESGGVPSGTENYYSFDFAQLHVVVLDSQASGLEPDSDMLGWLWRDLYATRQPWIIVAMHHPPYTKGSHDSDDNYDSRGRMQKLRKNILPVLDKAGVDLVLSGHSHMYERSNLVACHYGSSGTYRTDMAQAPFEKDGVMVYEKPLTVRAANSGSIYAVVGSSSKVDSGPLDHPAMAVSRQNMGSLVVDIKGHRLIGRFITDQGKIADEFVIEKGRGTKLPITCR